MSEYEAQNNSRLNISRFFIRTGFSVLDEIHGKESEQEDPFVFTQGF